MSSKDSPTLREEERRASQSRARDRAMIDSSRAAPTVSKPGSFRNDQDHPTNPNDVRERYLRKFRC